MLELISVMALPLAAGYFSCRREHPEPEDELFGKPMLLETAAGRLAVYGVGRGDKSLVFWPSVFSDHTMYRQQAAALQDEYQMLFIDGPGHGRSGPQAPGATIAEHAEAVAQVMDRWRIDRAAFVGTSWGGLVGTRLACSHPERLTTLLALNTPFDKQPTAPFAAARMIVLGARFVGNCSVFAKGVAASFFSRASQDGKRVMIDEFASRLAYVNASDMASVARTVLLDRESEMPNLSRIEVPVVVVAGSDDGNVGVDELKAAAARFRHGRFFEIADTAHCSALEAPEVVNRLIREACPQA